MISVLIIYTIYFFHDFFPYKAFYYKDIIQSIIKYEPCVINLNLYSFQLINKQIAKYNYHQHY